MGSTADDTLTAQKLRCGFAGTMREDASDRKLRALASAADRFAQEEHMPFEDALAIVSGESRKPYGTPKGPQPQYYNTNEF